ncbi:XRE family transcriptional regulator [Streptomyces sp. NPDC015532]|uniref:XRE family transcriptional regulator n=1 Tax=Streptomyces sp. NPDC015532 TaxID=3364960 RepID=UPI0036F652BE
MPRWKALPGELDPRVSELVDQLRLLVDRSGLGVAAVADRTGYSRTSWERYLNARLLAPKGAVVALAEVTGASPVHLATMWELAERAWSRSETRHETTMEALRASRARAAPGEFGPVVPAPAAGAPEPQDARPAGAGPGQGSARRKRRQMVLAAGVVGTLAVVAATLWLTRGGGTKDVGAPPKTPTASGSPRPVLPPGVKCGGASCGGKDPEKMGCGGRLATTATSVTVGTALVEVRYSKTCGAAWARVTRAAAGDRVEVSAGAGAKRTAVVGTDADTYTPMVVVKGAGDARACVTLGSGRTGCTA